MENFGNKPVPKDKISEFVFQNYKTLLMILAFAGVGTAAFFAYQNYKNQKNSNASQALSDLIEKLEKIGSEKDATNLSELSEEIKATLKEHSSSDLSALFNLVQASLLISQEEYTSAKNILNESKNQTSSDFLKDFINLQIARISLNDENEVVVKTAEEELEVLGLGANYATQKFALYELFEHFYKKQDFQKASSVGTTLLRKSKDITNKSNLDSGSIDAIVTKKMSLITEV